MTRAILSLNAGSSSIKFALFELDDHGLRPAVRGKIEGIGATPHLIARDASGEMLSERHWESATRMEHETFLGDLFDWIDGHLAGHDLAGVGHRVVHGGTRYSAPERVTPSLLAELETLCPLAPLHQPHNLSAIRAMTATRPHLLQVACFDTAFHHTQPPVATLFAIPRSLANEGVRRYGFHGLSYEYVTRTVAEIDPVLIQGRMIAAHLGNGASLCAIQGGRSIDTTMGFTALDGLVMGTRCGTIDAGVLLYLLQQKGLSAAAIETLLYERSGLLGLSGISGDVRALLASDDPRADEAIELFSYRAAREAGALASSLGGVDGLVFTAGIGENAPEIRARICRRLGWLGVELDEAANQRGEPVISLPSSRVVVRVLPTDEERMIAVHTMDMLHERPA